MYLQDKNKYRFVSISYHNFHQIKYLIIFLSIPLRMFLYINYCIYLSSIFRNNLINKLIHYNIKLLNLNNHFQNQNKEY